MAEVRWIKIYTDMINNKKIKRIRKMPEGNNIILIWVFLIAEAGKCNKNGGLFLTNVIPFSVGDLAIEFDFEVDVIKLALVALEKFEMIETYDDIIYIKNWDRYQNIEGMDKIREQNRLRNIKYREKLRLSNDVNNDVTVTSHDETEIEIEIEKEIEKEIDTKNKDDTKEIYIAVIDYLNSKCDTEYKSTTKATREFINGRLKEGFILDDFFKVIDIKSNEWLTDEKMKQFLRPSTLFSTKFEAYLNQAKQIKAEKTKPKKIYDDNYFSNRS